MAALSQAPSPTSPNPTGTNARKSALLASYGLPSQPGMVRAVAAAAAASSMNDNSSLPHRKGSISTTRSSHRYSQLYSMAAEQDVEVEDDLARAQKRLRELKAKISSQSKKNFVLERDVRYLDSRIALLIQNRMAIAEA
ncbi:glyceraldehyde-3-phosphate dehydrogenase 1, partial [Actinomortierella ambigua]